MSIPSDKLQEVRDRAGILEVVSDYVQLKRSGGNYQGLCPFHSEKTPSFNVNPARGIFHCFGCGSGGDVFAFVMKAEGIAFHEAVRLLAKKSGVLIEERPLSPQEKKRADERDLFFRANEVAASFYRGVLTGDKGGAPARRYLEARGVAAATAEAYRLGFAPSEWEALTRHLEKRGVPLAMAEKLGLVRRREGGGYYDTFRNRLLFVISDPQGRPIGFGGRVLDDSLPKYINSPESPVYRKSDVLFGVDMAKMAMREKGFVLVVEGYFDHLALFDAGCRNAVATCGTALTPAHASLLKRYSDRVYTLFDSDPAGMKATLRAVEVFLQEGMSSYVVELPAGEDPDSYVRTCGASALQERVEQAKPAVEFVIRTVVREENLGTVEGKVQAVERLAPLLEKLSHPIEREKYLLEVARLLDIRPAQLRERVAGKRVSLAPSPVPAVERRRNDPEETLLMLMVKFPEVSRRVAEEGVENLFRDELRALAEEIVSFPPDSASVLPRLLEKIGSEEEKGRLSALFLQDDHLQELELADALRVLDDCRTARNRRVLRHEDKELRMELGRLDPDSERYMEVLRTLEQLRKRKSQLS